MSEIRNNPSCKYLTLSKTFGKIRVLHFTFNIVVPWRNTMKRLVCCLVLCCLLLCENSFAQSRPGGGEFGTGSGGPSLISLGVGLNNGALSLPTAGGAVASNLTGDVAVNLQTGILVSGTNGGLELSLLTADGLAVTGDLVVKNGKWTLSYSAVPFIAQGFLSEVHGIIYGHMSATGTSSLSNPSGLLSGSASSSIWVYDNVSNEQALEILQSFDAAHIVGVGNVSMSARWGWNWHDFWIGCGAGAIAGGVGGGIVGSGGAGVGAVPGAVIGAIVGCVTGGVASGVTGGSGSTPEETHVVQSICIGTVVGGPCGAVGAYVWPVTPPPQPPLGSDPASQWAIAQLAARAGLYK